MQFGNLQKIVLLHIFLDPIYQELGNKIKKSIKRIEKGFFKQLAFNSDLEMLGTKKQKNSWSATLQNKTISKTVLWRLWLCNSLYCCFLYFTAHTLTEYFPSPSFIPQKSTRHMVHILIFCFIRGDGTPSMFGKDKNNIFN